MIIRPMVARCIVKFMEELFMVIAITIIEVYLVAWDTFNSKLF